MSDEKKTGRRKPGGSDPLEQTKKLDSAAVNAANETADNGGAAVKPEAGRQRRTHLRQTQPVRRQDEQGQKKAEQKGAYRHRSGTCRDRSRSRRIFRQTRAADRYRRHHDPDGRGDARNA